MYAITKISRIHKGFIYVFYNLLYYYDAIQTHLVLAQAAGVYLIFKCLYAEFSHSFTTAFKIHTFAHQIQ